MADSSGGRNVNAISKLLSNDENILVATILGHGNQAKATAVVEMFHAYPGSSQWTAFGSGIVCFVKDNTKRAYYIRLLDLGLHSVQFEQKVYDGFCYTKDTPTFHFFPGQELTMGLSFSDKDEALLFGQAVESRLSRRNDIKDPVNSDSFLTQHSFSIELGCEPTGAMPHRPGATPHRPGATPHRPRATRSLTKEDISKPSDFEHLSHIGLDRTTGKFEVNNISSEWKQLLDTVGVTYSVPPSPAPPSPPLDPSTGFPPPPLPTMSQKMVFPSPAAESEQPAPPAISDTHTVTKRRTKLKAHRSASSNFQHLKCLGIDPHTGELDVNNISSEWILLLDTVGITLEQLKDIHTAEFIYNFVEERGGIEEANRQLEESKNKAAPPLSVEKLPSNRVSLPPSPTRTSPPDVDKDNTPPCPLAPPSHPPSASTLSPSQASTPRSTLPAFLSLPPPPPHPPPARDGSPPPLSPSQASTPRSTLPAFLSLPPPPPHPPSARDGSPPPLSPSQASTPPPSGDHFTSPSTLSQEAPSTSPISPAPLTISRNASSGTQLKLARITSTPKLDGVPPITFPSNDQNDGAEEEEEKEKEEKEKSSM